MLSPSRYRRSKRLGQQIATTTASLAIALCLGGCDVAAQWERDLLEDRVITPESETDAAAPVGADKLGWVTNIWSLAVGDFDHDGHEDVAGLCLQPEAKRIALCSFSGSDYVQRWHTGSFARREAAHVRFARVGERILLADSFGQTQLLSADVGEVQGSVNLGGRVELLCSHPGDDGRVWVELAGGQSFTLAVPSMAKEPAAPSWRWACSRWPSRAAACLESAADNTPPTAACEAQPLPSPIEGLSPREIDYDVDYGVVLGRRSGKLSLAAFGVDQSDNAAGYPLLWQRGFEDGAAASAAMHLAAQQPSPKNMGGQIKVTRTRVVVGSKLEQASNEDVTTIAAFGSSSGKTQWRTRLASKLWKLEASEQRIYLDIGGRLDIRDAATGKRVALIGHE